MTSHYTRWLWPACLILLLVVAGCGTRSDKVNDANQQSDASAGSDTASGTDASSQPDGTTDSLSTDSIADSIQIADSLAPDLKSNDAVMDSHDTVMDRHDAVVDSSDAVVDSSDAVVDSSDAVVDSSDAVVDSTLDSGVSGDAGALDSEMSSDDGGSNPIDCVFCGGKTVCDTATGACVACLEASHCSDDTPACRVDSGDSTKNACVECVANPDCKDTAAPACDPATNTCVECVANTDCKDTAAPLCDPTSRVCVECVSHTDCKDLAAPLCDPTSRVCVECVSHTDCTLTSALTCEPTDHVCVECAFGAEGACGTKVCDVRLRTCTAKNAGSANLCKSCVSDRQCKPGQVCALRVGLAAGLSPVCLWRVDATDTAAAPKGDCTSIRPYSGERTAITVGGESVLVCDLRASTCEAFVTYGFDPCFLPNCGAPGVDDSGCVAFMAAETACAPRCNEAIDCPPGKGCTSGYCDF